MAISKPCIDLSCSAPGASTVSMPVYRTFGHIPVPAFQTESRGGREQVSFEKCWQSVSVNGWISLPLSWLSFKVFYLALKLINGA